MATTERSIGIIQKFPVKPDRHIIYVVYSEDMVKSIEDLISDVHGKYYFDNYVSVTSTDGTPLKSLAGKGCMMYFDPMVHAYNGNGYN